MRLGLPTTSPAATHVIVASVVGVAAGIIAGATFDRPLVALLAGWGAAAATFVGTAIATTWLLDAAETASHATREEPTRAVAHTIVLVAGLVSLAGVIAVIATTSDVDRLTGVGVCILAALASWASIHTLYALRYARLYYTGADGGIDYHQDAPPRYSDFYYTAFAVGMSYAISDTDLASSDMRRAALGHAVLSYLFGAVILAALINLLASL